MIPALPSYAPEDLRSYCDANTASFERFGQGGQALRRAVWGPGVRTRREAFRYVDDRILTELTSLRAGNRSPARVLDLGCGLGASLRYLACKADLEGVGVTISPVQAAAARRRLAKAGLTGRIRCVEASFTDLPEELGRFDLAFAIEAFVHSPKPELFFREAAAHLLPSGKLVLCDDFLSTRAEQASRRERRWIKDFARGWMVSSLLTPAAAVRIAAAQGLSLLRDENLTSFLELRRPRDKLITALVALGRHLPIPVPIPGHLWRSWRGGDALQHGLRAGLFEYRLVVFQKSPGCDTAA